MRRPVYLVPLATAMAIAIARSVVFAQQAPAPPPPAPKAAAPVDLTGEWVSVVSEDWRWRMMTPARGDYASVPMTPAARTLADTWDPVRDEAAGEQCRSYAAPAIMRVPGRVRISWQDDYTLKIETDAGMQTRLLHFQPPSTPPLAPPAAAQRSWQGFSVARWEAQPGAFTGGGVGGPTPAPATTRSLQVTTTQIRPGYLRKNGVPFSEDAQVTEYFETWKDSGDQWFTVMTVVTDPRYLRQPFVTTTDFRKERNDEKWDPTPCRAR